MARKPALDPTTVRNAIAAHPHGVGIDALAATFVAVPRRNLQRSVAALVEQGGLRAEGNGRARKYHAVIPDTLSDSAAQATEPDIAISAEAAQVRDLVRRPLARRTPVGYRREFLEHYVPNETAWLAPPLRAHLHRLGRSLVEHQAAGTYARQVLDRLLIDLSWASSRLEGNTYSRLDTQNLIQFGLAAAGKDQLEAQMILNHKAAIEMLVDEAQGIGFNRYTLQNLHALLSDNLLPDPGAGGRLRQMDVAISGSVYQPLAIPQRISEHFDALLAKARDIDDPFEQAFFAMVQLPYLQPFDDVDKRTSRLAANIPLIRQNLAPLSFVDGCKKGVRFIFQPITQRCRCTRLRLMAAGPVVRPHAGRPSEVRSPHECPARPRQPWHQLSRSREGRVRGRRSWNLSSRSRWRGAWHYLLRPACLAKGVRESSPQMIQRK